MRKKAIKSGEIKMPCTGCGRHAAIVDEAVKARFCNNCFVVNGNYYRYQAGLPMIKPLTNLKVKDIVLGCDGEKYKIIGKGELFKEDKYYPCKRLRDGEETILGDFFFQEKI